MVSGTVSNWAGKPWPPNQRRRERGAPLVLFWLLCGALALYGQAGSAPGGEHGSDSRGAPGGTRGGAPVHAPADSSREPAIEREHRGEDEIVLVHGLGSSAAVWDEVAPLLSRAFRVWAFELPGHGRTPPMRQLTVTSAAEELGRYLNANDIAYPVLVGHAMGGLIAMRYTFDHPAEVRRLVVIDAGPKQLATAEQKAQIAEALVRDYDAFVAGMYQAMSPDPEVTTRIVDQALRTEEVSFRSLLLSSFDFDLTEELPRQAVPILVIGSQMLFPDGVKQTDRLGEMGYAGARTISFKRMEYTGHFVMLEQPDYLASVLAAFALSE